MILPEQTNDVWNWLIDDLTTTLSEQILCTEVIGDIELTTYSVKRDTCHLYQFLPISPKNIIKYIEMPNIKTAQIDGTELVYVKLPCGYTWELDQGTEFYISGEVCDCFLGNCTKTRQKMDRPCEYCKVTYYNPISET